MYFIDKEEFLIGKEIIFTHFAQFTDAMVIVTKDKGVFVFNKEYDFGEDDYETRVFSEIFARQHIFKNDYIRNELDKLNIISKEEMDEYKRQLEEKKKAEREKLDKYQEERDYQNYLRLKEKFEDKENRNE